MPPRRYGPLALALAIVGMGTLLLSARELRLVWEPVPAWLPAPAPLAVACGLILVSGGIGLFFARTRAPCAWGLALYELIWVLARGTQALRDPGNVGGWESLCEALAVFSGLGLLAAGSSRATSGPPRPEIAAPVARALFGASCLVFGLSHFAYAELTAGMIPGWLPAHLGLAYATGAAHATTGAAILARRRDRLAANLEALMLACFVVLVHLPSLWTIPPPQWAPTAADRWSELLIALSVAGAAKTVAESLLERRPAAALTPSGALS